MTRKQQTSSDSDQHNGGYCEMCCEDYCDLAGHLTTPGHIKLATDPTHFAALDNLIKETFHNQNNTNGSDGVSCNLLAISNIGRQRRVLRSNRSPVGVGAGGCHDSMGNKHTNSDKQHQQQLSPINNTTAAATQRASPVMTNGHVTRSTTAIQRQQSLSSSSSTTSSSSSSTTSSSTANSVCNSVHRGPLVAGDRDDSTAADVNGRVGMAKSSPHVGPLQEVQCNGITTNHCHLTRLSVKTESLLHEKQQQKMSPTNSVENTSGSGGSHHLRSKKQLWLPSSLLGTTAEDNGNPVRGRGSEKESPSPTTMKGHDPIRCTPNGSGGVMTSSSSSSSSLKARRRKMRHKRLSVEERLIEDNKSYYKVEVLNSKLRSTGYYMTQRELELNRLKTNHDDGVVDDAVADMKVEEKEPVVVRFKKVRKSELSILSDEAESFMFSDSIRKETDFEDDDPDECDEDGGTETEEDCWNSSASGNRLSATSKDKEMVVKKEEIVDESSLETCCSSSNQSVVGKRRRRTHAEVFIHDNLDYYKFDIQGSRLRLHHAGLLQPLKIDTISLKGDEVKLENNFPKLENDLITDIKKEECDDSELSSTRELHFSFEKAPDSEPWFQAFKRQDEFNELYHPAYADYPRTRLLYEYPSLEKRKLLSRCKTTTTMVGNKMVTFRRKKRHRRFLKNLDDKPRKSPRCHASTLAILSSLKYRRSRKDAALATSPDKLNVSSRSELHRPTIAAANHLKLSIDEDSSLLDVSKSHQDNLPLSKLLDKSSAIKSVQNARDVAENIDQYFYKSFSDNVANDKYYHILKLFRSALMNADDESGGSPSVATTPAPKSRRVKSASSSGEKSSELSVCGDFDACCLDVDPDIIEEMRDITTTLAPGPELDMAVLMDSYKQCNSMERADFEQLHPRAVDALRAFSVRNDGSCNSSDCGGSSTCELLGFTEDGRMMSRRRKRKKRNMTGWPKDRPRRFHNTATPTKGGGEFTSVRSLMKLSCGDNNHAADEHANGNSDKNVDVNKQTNNTIDCASVGTDTTPLLSCKRLSVNGSDDVEQTVVAKSHANKIHPRKIKMTRSLSRTCSIDSRTLSRTGSIDSTVPLSEYNVCVVQMNSRQLRGSSTLVEGGAAGGPGGAVVSKSSPMKRRASSPEKRSPGRAGRRRRHCATRWSPWASRKGR